MAKGKKSGGRQIGSVNKLTKSFKELVQTTFMQLEESGQGMLLWAQTNKTEFYKIASKLIPTEVTGTVKTLNIHVIRREGCIGDPMRLTPGTEEDSIGGEEIQCP